MPGSGLSLPLNLSKIASCCKGSYYAPRRFAVCFRNFQAPFNMESDYACFVFCATKAVQLAYSEPRCRVLIFRVCHGIELTLIRSTLTT